MAKERVALLTCQCGHRQQVRIRHTPGSDQVRPCDYCGTPLPAEQLLVSHG